MSSNPKFYHDPWPDETMSKGDPPTFVDVVNPPRQTETPWWANSSSALLKLRSKGMNETTRGSSLLEDKKGFKLAFADSWKLIKLHLVTVLWLAGFLYLFL